MPNTILAIETSNRYCSVALVYEGHHYEQRYQIERGHTKQVLPLVEQVLHQAGITLDQLDAVAYGKGPGSFTGLRVGISFAQGLALALDIPLLAVSSLKTLAVATYQSLNQQSNGYYLAAFDARMKEAYLASFQIVDGVITQLTADELKLISEIDLADYHVANESLFLSGSAFAHLAQMQNNHIQSNPLVDAEPSAVFMLQEAAELFEKQQFVNVDQPELTYLRDNIVQS